MATKHFYLCVQLTYPSSKSTNNSKISIYRNKREKQNWDSYRKGEEIDQQRMALSDGEESLTLTLPTAWDRLPCCLGLQKENSSCHNHTIPAWNHRAGSPHPLQLLGGVGSTLNPQALGAPHPHLHIPELHTPALHIPAHSSAGKRAQKPSPRWASPVMNQTGSKAGAACPSCHPSVLPRVSPLSGPGSHN